MEIEIKKIIVNSGWNLDTVEFQYKRNGRNPKFRFYRNCLKPGSYFGLQLQTAIYCSTQKWTATANVKIFLTFLEQ